MTNIIFMGTPAFSVPILEGLIEAGYHIQAVVTQPDRPVGRKKVLTPPPVKEAAAKHGLKILQPEKISGSAEMEEIIRLAPDVIVTAAFGQFLPEKILQAPKSGALNVHASLLPKYRGGAPVHYAIMAGEKDAGVTIMEMIKKMDAGGIFSQKRIPITSQDDVGTMFDKLSLLGRDLLLETLPKILHGELKPVPQAEAEATFSPNISREEEGIDWQKPALEVDRKVRGLRPWPIAFTVHQGENWKIWRTQVLEETTEEAPGTIIRKDKKELWVACGEGSAIAILELQPAGKSRQEIRAFLNGTGQKVKAGERLG